MRASVTAHYLALSLADRGLRFGTPFSSAALTSYVDRIDFDRDAVFVARDRQQALVGVVHAAVLGDVAELGLSVLAEHRARGIGSALFQRALAHVRNRRIPRLVMHFLWGNAPIMRIARKFRMSVASSAGEATARLDLLPPLSRSLPEALGAGAFIPDTSTLKENPNASRHAEC